MLSEERLEELVAWRPGAKTDILAATREEWQDIARELREARAKLAALEAKLAAVLERLSCAEIDELCCVWGTPAHHRTDDGETYFWAFEKHELPVADTLSELLVAARDLSARAQRVADAPAAHPGGQEGETDASKTDNY